MERFLVTGALGCLGAWVIHQLVREGVAVVGSDVGSDTRRLRLLLREEELASVPLVHGDVTDLGSLERLLEEHEITRLIHLAALQVPFCRESPPLGAAVNVVGTVNVFEAVKRRRDRIRGVVYASSTAVYGASDTGASDERTRPDTHYGVYKVANEGTARIYWQDDALPSIGLRPFSVYGPGRDQGVTSYPTQAMLAAARGEGFHIPWGGTARHHHARDIADAFIASSRVALDGARVYNLPGADVHMGDVVAAIEAAAPDVVGRVTFDETTLPFPPATEVGGFTEDVAAVDWTPLEDGVRQTIEHFREVDPASLIAGAPA